MVSRFSFRLRTVLPALALVVALGSLTPGIAHARNPYKYTSRTEGDPGDGVLKPAEQPGGSGNISDSPTSTAAALGADPTLVTEFQVMVLPVGGGRLVIFLPTNWSPLTAIFERVEGGAHHAP